jgi:hypothetical protein
VIVQLCVPVPVVFWLGLAAIENVGRSANDANSRLPSGQYRAAFFGDIEKGWTPLLPQVNTGTFPTETCPGANGHPKMRVGTPAVVAVVVLSLTSVSVPKAPLTHRAVRHDPGRDR